VHSVIISSEVIGNTSHPVMNCVGFWSTDKKVTLLRYHDLLSATLYLDAFLHRVHEKTITLYTSP